MLLLPPPEGSYNKNPPERDSRTGEGLLAPDVTLVTCVRSGIGILSLLHLPLWASRALRGRLRLSTLMSGLGGRRGRSWEATWPAGHRGRAAHKLPGSITHFPVSPRCLCCSLLT